MPELFIFIRGIITYIWVGFSTFVYSMMCMVGVLISKKAAYRVGVMWCRHVLAVGGVSITVKGLEKIKPYKKYILVCNHQSNLDIASLMAGLPIHLIFVAKKELFRTPFFGWGIKALGHIAIDRSNARKARVSFLKAGDKLKKAKQQSLVIFPEGTRSKDGKVREFKPGSFALALETGLLVLPIAIEGTYQALPKDKLLIRPAKVTLKIGEVINPDAFSKHEKDKIAQTAQKQIYDLVGQQS